MHTHIYQTNSINLNINVNKEFLVRTVNEIDRAYIEAWERHIYVYKSESLMGRYVGTEGSIINWI
jgi:hypothetical protein